MSKVVLTFMATVSKTPVTYNGHTTYPLPVVVSPNVFRGFTCPEACGACCGKGALDYIPGELVPDFVAPRTVEVNGKQFAILTDAQEDVIHSSFCRHLTIPNARCNAYAARPFPCDFAILNVNSYKTYRLLTCRKFGRFFKWPRPDGQRGTMCEIFEPTPESIADTRRRLLRLRAWTNFFELDSWMDNILDWANQDPIPTQPLRCE